MTEAAAFAAFVSAHTRSLFGTAYLLTGRTEAAEELVQDTFGALYPKWHRVEASDQPLAYVRRAVVNRYLGARRLKSMNELPLWEMPDRAAPEDVAQRVADRRYLFEMLGTLPERQRAAIVLRYFHDLPDPEIAAAIGCRTATVRSLISRGVSALREQAATKTAIGGAR